MKHRILFVLSSFPALGGIEKVSLHLALALRGEGHRVAFASWHSSAPAWPQCEEFDCHSLPNQHLIYAKENLFFLKELIEKEDFDIILNQGVEIPIHTCFVGSKRHHVINVLHADPDWLFRRRRQMKLPAAFWKPAHWKATLRWAYIHCFPRLSDHKLSRLLRADLQQAAAYVVLHPSYADKLLQYTALSPNECRLLAIPDAVSASRVQSSCEKIVLYSGRFSCADKGLDHLMRIWQKVQARLPQWQLHLVGDGPDKALLEQMAQELHLQRISFLPPVWDDALYAQASVFALPSRTEAQGMSQMEAQQAGMVPVVFDINGMMNQMLQDGACGILVPPYDEDAFADALYELCSNDALREAMSLRARENMQVYQMSSILPKWLSLFATLSH